MAEERDLREQVQEGLDALHLLENESFVNSKESVRAHLMNLWYHTGPSQNSEREQLWAMLQALDMVCNLLQETVDTGKLATATLDELQMATQQERD